MQVIKICSLSREFFNLTFISWTDVNNIKLLENLGIRDFMFSQFDRKRLNRGIKYTRKIRNLQYVQYKSLGTALTWSIQSNSFSLFLNSWWNCFLTIISIFFLVDSLAVVQLCSNYYKNFRRKY